MRVTKLGARARRAILGALLGFGSAFLFACESKDRPGQPVEDKPVDGTQFPWVKIDNPDRDGSPQTRAILKQLDARPGMNVADIGAGGGYFAFKIAKQLGGRGTVVATDLDPQMVALMRSEKKKRGVSNLKIQQAEANATGLGIESVHRILMVNSVPFVDCGFDPHAYLADCYQALRSGGLLVIHRDAVHTREWNPSVGPRPKCDEPTGQQLAALASPYFELVAKKDYPIAGQAPRGVKPGFLLTLRRRARVKR